MHVATVICKGDQECRPVVTSERKSCIYAAVHRRYSSRVRCYTACTLRPARAEHVSLFLLLYSQLCSTINNYAISFQLLSSTNIRNVDILLCFPWCVVAECWFPSYLCRNEHLISLPLMLSSTMRASVLAVLMIPGSITLPTRLHSARQSR